MAVRDGRGDVKQTTTGFRGPLMVQSLTSAKSKFLSLRFVTQTYIKNVPALNRNVASQYWCYLLIILNN